MWLGIVTLTTASTVSTPTHRDCDRFAAALAPTYERSCSHLAEVRRRSGGGEGSSSSLGRYGSAAMMTPPRSYTHRQETKCGHKNSTRTSNASCCTCPNHHLPSLRHGDEAATLVWCHMDLARFEVGLRARVPRVSGDDSPALPQPVAIMTAATHTYHREAWCGT